ncbi:MAG: aldehyde dehydrogenase family protein [Acidobacteriota bacterium]
MSTASTHEASPRINGIPPHDAARSSRQATPTPDIDRALDELRAQADSWANLPIRDRRAILAELSRDLESVGARWAEAMRQAEGLPAGEPRAGEEWLVGPYLIQRNLQLLDEALADIEKVGHPKVPGPVTERPDGRVVAEVFPGRIYDRIFYPGVTAEVWMDRQVTKNGLAATQARIYRETDHSGAIALVLGAGNVSSIGPTDALYKLFVENQVVVYKLHELNDHLGPLLGEAFQALIDWGVLRLVYGGADVGAYLCAHDQVDEIHITGSDKTVEAIVFGSGEEGARRKDAREPRLQKPISSELGNVSPFIVVPGPWTRQEIDYHAENIVASLTNNAGFNCNATRVIVLHRDWPQRTELVDAIRRHLAKTPTRTAYYPGAEDRHAAFVREHPEAERFGEPGPGELPWTLIPEVDAADKDDIAFHTEAFCGVFAVTLLDGEGAAGFLDRAVDFVNETLWGTLSASLAVHPASLDVPAVRDAFERALEGLRYGTIGVNCWAAVGFGLISTPWGAYPGHDLYDIQSGSGVVHNTLMFEHPEKVVIRAPFQMRPKPPWFPSHKTALGLSKKLAAFEADPSPLRLPGILWTAIRA